MNEDKITDLHAALNEALKGLISIHQDGWSTVTATVDTRVLAERLYLRGVRKKEDR